MSTHTPGPWLFDTAYDWRDKVGSGWKRHAQIVAMNPATKCRTNIARCISNAMDVDNVANGYLIAAAPDSHAANLATVAALDEAFGIKATHDDDYIYDTLPSSGIARAYFMARAAIARANQGH